MNNEVDGAGFETADGHWQEPPGLGRAIVIGSVVAVVVSFVGVTIGAVALGAEIGSALGLGGFVAFWGGIGFGTMLGGVVWASRQEAADEAAHTRVPEPMAATRREEPLVEAVSS